MPRISQSILIFSHQLRLSHLIVHCILCMYAILSSSFDMFTSSTEFNGRSASLRLVNSYTYEYVGLRDRFNTGNVFSSLLESWNQHYHNTKTLYCTMLTLILSSWFENLWLDSVETQQEHIARDKVDWNQVSSEVRVLKHFISWSFACTRVHCNDVWYVRYDISEWSN